MQRNLLYPAFHGVLIAVVYSVIKHLDGGGSLEKFTTGMTLALILFVPFCLRSSQEILKPILIVKGLSFGLTQIFIYKTLVNSGVGNTMIASLFGGIVVTILGALIFKEKIDKQGYIGVFLSFTGSFIYFFCKADVISISTFAFIAGLLQGTTTLITRSNVRNSFSKEGIVFSNLFWGSLTLLSYYFFFNSDLPSLKSMLDLKSFWIAGSIIIAQTSLFLMMKLSNTQLSSSLSLTRIPTSISIDILFWGGVISIADILPASLIVLGILITSVPRRLAGKIKKEVLPKSA